MKILFVLIISINLEETNHYYHHHSLRVLEDPTEEELERILAVNSMFTSKGEERPELEEFLEWLKVEERKRNNWGFVLADATIRYGPFDHVVICGAVDTGKDLL